MRVGVVVPAALAPGAVIADRYELGELVGSGGMGRVWRAHDRVLDRTVAIKVLRGEYADDEAFRIRLRAEARAAAAIAHPNVVQVFDYGEEQAPDGGCIAYIVMELIAGEPLSAILAAGPLPAERVRQILRDVAGGLAAAHAGGVVHRDIKPANLIVGADGSVKLTDFGIARAADAAALTTTGELIGTAQYLAPEQVNGQTATARSDLYSLGVVAYHCLAGHPPYSEGSPVEVALAHLNSEPPPLPDGVPADLSALVLGLMAKDPNDRPTSAAVLVAESASDSGLSAGDQTLVMAVPPTADAPTEVIAATTARADRTTPDWLRRFGPYLFGLVVLIVVAMVATYAGSSSDAPRLVRVPTVAGMKLAAAKTSLHDRGLHYVVHRRDGNTPRGTVLAATPTGRRVPVGATVALTVASGYVTLHPQSVIGLSYAAAAEKIRGLGLAPQQQLVYGVGARDQVLGVSPSGRLRRGTPVVIRASAPTPTPPAPPAHAKHGPPGHEKPGPGKDEKH
jgi:eukaryotic-like serine/threonine-protein kinase